MSGALVISLDFELHWGVFDKQSTTGPYAPNLLGAREAIPRMLQLFSEHDVAATWAIVGFLFAESTRDREEFDPAVLPQYRESRFNPYGVPVGPDEQTDPFHYAPSLIRQIQRSPGQEIATHTYSHLRCHEDGQDASMFDADIASAVAIARRYDVSLRSIVFPSNQHNAAYDDVLLKHGIRSYRGNPETRFFPERASSRQNSIALRAGRLADSYVNMSGHNLTDWADVPQPSGLCNVAGSAFLRPYDPTLRALESFRRGRIVRSMRRAARQGKLFHLWWHPHNFGCHTERNLEFLATLLREYKRLEDRYGMRSLSMIEVADEANAPGAIQADGRSSTGLPFAPSQEPAALRCRHEVLERG